MAIYAEIKPSYTDVPRYRKVNDFYGIYDLVDTILQFEDEEKQHKIAESAACWCETHCIGETYEHELFTITIVED